MNKKKKTDRNQSPDLVLKKKKIKNVLHEVRLFLKSCPAWWGADVVREVILRRGSASRWSFLAGRVLLRDWLVSLCCWVESGSLPRRRATAGSRGCRSDAPELSSAGQKTNSTSVMKDWKSMFHIWMTVNPLHSKPHSSCSYSGVFKKGWNFWLVIEALSPSNVA